jgi:hypothetical protein
VRAHDHERRPVVDALRLLRGALERLDGQVLANVLHVPAVGLETLPDVLAEVAVGRSRELDVVVVEEHDQPAEPEVAGERAGLGGHALLDVAVARDHVGVVVDQLGAAGVEARGQHPLRERQADRHREPLAERAGRGLDSGSVVVLGVAGGRAPELAEVLQVVQRDAVAREVQGRVEEHRSVSRRQHEPVAVEPVRVVGAVPHHSRVERERQWGERHRRARMAGVGLLDGVHRERPDRVDCELDAALRTGRHSIPSLVVALDGSVSRSR